MSPIIQSPSTLAAANLRRDIAVDLDHRLNEAALEASTGRKSDVYKSLGLKSGELSALRSHTNRNNGFIDGNTLLGNRLAVMSNALGEVRAAVQDFLEVAISYRDNTAPVAKVLQTSARAAYDQISTLINTPYEGTQLFGGTESRDPTLQPWDATNAASGLAPKDVMAGIVSGGFADAADAVAKAAEVELAFANASANPSLNFEATFYNGTPLEIAPGVPAGRMAALIETATTLDYGVQANDSAFTTTLQGLAMVASIDPASINDPDAYEAWIGTAIDSVAEGLDLINATETRLGGHQRLIETTIERQKERADLYTGQLSLLEGVDPYEAANRVNMLSTQLQATYAITARISQLTILNFLR